MPEITVTITDDLERRKLQGFRHFWGMDVTGFNPKSHCLPCLIGERQWAIKWDMPVNQTKTLNVVGVLYLCGVAYPWDYNSNFHMPLEPTGNPEDVVTMETYRGQCVTVTGVRLLPIDPEPAARIPGTSAKQRSCRNYQFAADYFAADL